MSSCFDAFACSCARRMVEEKFGEGSDEHIQALQELSDACLNAGKQALAAPIFMSLARPDIICRCSLSTPLFVPRFGLFSPFWAVGWARQLRSYYGSSRLDSWAAAEIQAPSHHFSGLVYIYIYQISIYIYITIFIHTHCIYLCIRVYYSDDVFV